MLVKGRKVHRSWRLKFISLDWEITGLDLTMARDYPRFGMIETDLEAKQFVTL
jgi:hypothetical protein